MLGIALRLQPFVFFLSMQCMHPNEACTSVSGETIIKMMMNSKTSTKPLVVISDKGDLEGEGDDDIYIGYTNKKMPGKTYLDREGYHMS